LARLSNGLILSRIVTAVNRNDGHLLHIKAPKPFSGSHLMAINAIKGIGPALGAIYMYTTLLRSNRGFNHLQRFQSPSTPVQSHSPGQHDHNRL
ncbi:hypothetical protein L195_g055589, partial [Trifolium pratense]